MKTTVIISGLAAALALGSAAHAQTTTQPSNISAGIGAPLMNDAAAAYAQQNGGTGLMGPGVTGPRSTSGAMTSSDAAPSAGSYSTNTAAQSSGAMSGGMARDGGGMGGGGIGQTSGGQMSTGGMGSSSSTTDTGAMMRAGERG